MPAKDRVNTVTHSKTGFSSEGQRQLCVVPGSLSEIAAQVGLSKAALSQYRSGTRTPTEDAAARLEILGIPARAWTTAAQAQAPALQAQAQAPASAPARHLPPVDAEQVTTIEGIDALIAAAQKARQDPTITGQVQAKFAAELRALHALRARVVRDAVREAEVREDTLARHPAFRQLMNEILDVIGTDPDMLARVAERLGARSAG